MTFFMGLTPPDMPGAQNTRLEEAVILKDGFSLPAFLLTGLWLLYKRLWWPFALFIVVWLVAGFGLPRLGLPREAIGLVQLVVGLFLGHEGHAMVEAKLVRDGWRLAGVVEAKDMDAAERRFFEQALGAAPAMSPAPPPQRPFAALAQNPIIGLFPEARGR